ncbi:Tex family protein [uncultured Alistipes sp.]|uniref:Tex family protein n=1 Tax=uncultured Alistipes sp. TaxID=538949 RepID=UPI002602531C|nr:Tex family protein [uncultured Alistipes sp.]
MLEQIISQRLQIALPQVQGTVRLLREGATIPFISRYRKEATGSLDEVQIGAVREQLDKLTELEARRQTVFATIEAQGSLTGELRQRIAACWDAVELEDIYLPYKPKRRTRATVARERGLEPLANIIQAQNARDAAQQARRFVTADVPTPEEALAGACDIIAERIAEDERARNSVRRTFAREGIVHSKVVKGKDAGGVKYSDYFDATSPLRSISSHRFLAMRRGEDDGILKISIDADAGRITENLCRQFIRPGSATREYMETAVADSFKRLIRPSIETEMLAAAKEKADDEAIRVFAENLRQLLLSAPLGQKRVIAVDPGFRTGCKVVVLDAQGNLVHNTTIYPHPPQNRYAEAAETLKTLAAKYKAEAFAVGDGTAGRETEQLVRSLGLDGSVQLFMVSEDGASVYSASAAAREEFPDYDVTVRGAVSIGRRLIDPLSELVKIDPKSIGVGQYQHSVDQPKLKARLNTVVESCVNRVGVNINTASKHILTYISGLGPALAGNIVAYRTANGSFKSRKEVLKVPRLGAKAYEQAAGFLRVVGGENPLDNSAVHPESYHIVERMAADAGVSVDRLLADKELRKTLKPERYVTEKVGLPTVTDILEALDKRGLDPREQLQVFSFDPNVHTIDDLRTGMRLPGIVTNITAFGAFVDIGIKQDGLVHISQLADRYVASPADAVHLGQHVEVRVTAIDTVRNRISLSMRSEA